MSNREWEAMGDTGFDALLEDTVPDSPPEDIVARVTPWKKSFNRALAGMALTAVTLNFWGLNYILPAIGAMLQLLGFRALRHENRWFGCCFAASVLRAAYFFPSLILNTTILQSAVLESAIGSVLTGVSLLLTFLSLVGLWRGLTAVQRKAGVPPHAGGAAALIAWYAFMCLLALVQYSGWIIAVLMLVGYFFILRSLYRLSGELDEAGYAVRTAPVRVTDRCIVISLTSLLLAGMVCGYLLGGSYPMEWSAKSAAEHNDVGDVKARLKSLGFPEYALDDLSAEDLAACRNALRVVVDVAAWPVDEAGGGRRGVLNASRKAICAIEGLRITGIGVQVPGERERWIIFHHFLWTADPGFYGTESIQLWPVYRDITDGWRSAGDVTGRVLYDGDGETYVAGYYFLGDQTFTSDSVFWGSRSNTDVFAAFSMPRNGRNHRGYVAYPVEEVQDGYIINSWFNYTHQRSWMQYPAKTAMETRMANSWSGDGAFRTIQDALQFFPAEEGAEPIG